MAAMITVGFLLAFGVTEGSMRNDDFDFPFYELGTIPAWRDLSSLRGTQAPKDFDKETYHRQLKDLDIAHLYESISNLMTDSKAFWPADGPQDGDVASYAGLFERLAWHCAGTLRVVNGTATGGCEGARQRHWPENEWRDNTNLDKARGLLGQVKQQFGSQISWSDLITFAGTVAIKASGGPAKKFCFGRIDDVDGKRSIPLGVEGVKECRGNKFCKSNFECPVAFRWPEQDPSDHARCNLTQPNHRLQASHSVGLIYVFPEGPQLNSSAQGYVAKQVHNRSPKLSALEVRDTFHERMGWTDRETVALIGGGHTLGRTHGNCNLTGTKWASHPYNEVGPYFEAQTGSLRGPTDGTCGVGASAGLAENTVSSGFEGPWARTPSKWNYDFFDAMLEEEWEPVKSPFGADQWRTKNRQSTYASTMRLTADLSLINDETYAAIVKEYAADHSKFDSDFADAWYKLVHRSQDNPDENDLARKFGVCTLFEFV
mmetsp:Transcript_6232/g.7731  ORF Transcript_6232/g.7731 Transcript_6232/m.7731 type:complete len:487 (-) Transcript_6232:203-1663(-)|eukprot:CAMPEP_0114662974 /NCGR_PEP_ID=MMETSP0191-20121206/26022_1 /TAXON_ID=126664 /ORGANISM="Sorites sp." /LENGTH=486 /DNA_ID=CAMNT_0001901009 /DNA_START=71 /DNA_END=1531 /DNA_ORIENTATION=+